MTVLRWHAHADHRLRNSGDDIHGHQCRVAMLCHSLAAYIGHPLHDSDLPHAALRHDEAERVLGDMPGPAKYNSRRWPLHMPKPSSRCLPKWVTTGP
jgi:5'-deoxynucleotidase YfbR-like HD superfamily hydrolase